MAPLSCRAALVAGCSHYAAAALAQLSVYIKLVCKTFWSATYMGIPELLLRRGVFQEWMRTLHAALQQQEPPVSILEACMGAGH
jgi:hypothetical protein